MAFCLIIHGLVFLYHLQITLNHTQRLDASGYSLVKSALETIGQFSGINATDKVLDDKAGRQTTNPGIEVVCGRYGGIVQLVMTYESLIHKKLFPKEGSQHSSENETSPCLEEM
jgi:hypothetical protein